VRAICSAHLDVIALIVFCEGCHLRSLVWLFVTRFRPSIRYLTPLKSEQQSVLNHLPCCRISRGFVMSSYYDLLVHYVNPATPIPHRIFVSHAAGDRSVCVHVTSGHPGNMAFLINISRYRPSVYRVLKLGNGFNRWKVFCFVTAVFRSGKWRARTWTAVSVVYFEDKSL
jgi:hypothetical protein